MRKNLHEACRDQRVELRSEGIIGLLAQADGVFDVGSIGGSTRRNLDQHDGITLVWPPREPGGYSLIVDGTGDATDTSLRVVPDRAVLHRPATAGSTPRPGCKDDCMPLER